MLDIIQNAISKGAKIYASVSGGKDGQAMAKSLDNWGFKVTGYIHADLGRVEWKESLPMCEKLAQEFGAPLHIVTRRDGLDMLGVWQRRMNQLKGQGKPFWSSASQRYCTSELKRDPINVFIRNCGNDFTISCEGIRADESKKRKEMQPLQIRERVSSTYYKGMTVEEAIANYKPGKRLSLTWFPIFNFSTADVWATYNTSQEALQAARVEFKTTGKVPASWPFHAAYAYGNDRVSCMFCVLGSLNDLKTGACHNMQLLNTLIGMEEESGYTFKTKWSLKELRA